MSDLDRHPELLRMPNPFPWARNWRVLRSFGALTAEFDVDGIPGVIVLPRHLPGPNHPWDWSGARCPVERPTWWNPKMLILDQAVA